MWLCADEVQDFSERVEYVINGNHTFLFHVLAEVRPIACDIRPSVLKMEFPDDSTDVEMSKRVEIANLSDASAEYSWKYDTSADSSYVIQPSAGNIPAHSSVYATVTFRATSKCVSDVVMSLLVVGGDELVSPPTLTCSALVDEPKIVFPAKKVRCCAPVLCFCESRVTWARVCRLTLVPFVWPLRLSVWPA